MKISQYDSMSMTAVASAPHDSTTSLRDSHDIGLSSKSSGFLHVWKEECVYLLFFSEKHQWPIKGRIQRLSFIY